MRRTGALWAPGGGSEVNKVIGGQQGGGEWFKRRGATTHGVGTRLDEFSREGREREKISKGPHWIVGGRLNTKDLRCSSGNRQKSNDKRERQCLQPLLQQLDAAINPGEWAAESVITSSEPKESFLTKVHDQQNK